MPNKGSLVQAIQRKTNMLKGDLIYMYKIGFVIFNLIIQKTVMGHRKKISTCI